MQKHATPMIVASALLLLPLLYVATYLALVRPRGVATQFIVDGKVANGRLLNTHYQACNGLCEWIFLPLEQLDRKIRPRDWSDQPSNLTPIDHP